jgi:hypothetical protein
VLISENQGVYVNTEDHIVQDYTVSTWEKRCLEVSEMWQQDIGKIDEIRQKTKRALLEKSWEVEIKVLEILSKN